MKSTSVAFGQTTYVPFAHSENRENPPEVSRKEHVMMAKTSPHIEQERQSIVKTLVGFGQSAYSASARSGHSPKATQIEEPPSLAVMKVKTLPQCRTTVHPKGNAAMSRRLIADAGILLSSPKNRFSCFGEDKAHNHNTLEEEKIAARIIGNRLA